MIRGGPLRRSASLKRLTPLRPMSKKKRQQRAETAPVRAVVTDLPCLLCGTRRDVHPHHRLLQSQGGKDEEANLIPLCNRCHDRVHDKNGRAYRAGLLVRSWESPADVPILTEEWFA